MLVVSVYTHSFTHDLEQKSAWFLSDLNPNIPAVLTAANQPFAAVLQAFILKTSLTSSTSVQRLMRFSLNLASQSSLLNLKEAPCDGEEMIHVLYQQLTTSLVNI